MLWLTACRLALKSRPNGSQREQRQETHNTDRQDKKSPAREEQEEEKKEKNKRKMRGSSKNKYESTQEGSTSC